MRRGARSKLAARGEGGISRPLQRRHWHACVLRLAWVEGSLPGACLQLGKEGHCSDHAEGKRAAAPAAEG